MANPTSFVDMPLDNTLIYKAERLATGANAHKLRSTMHLYVNAVYLVNQGKNDLMGEAEHWEQELHDLVATERHAQVPWVRTKHV